MGYSQIVLLEDFESMYPAGDLNNFEGTSSASIVADPAPGGTNGNVLEIVSEASGNPWQGASMLMQDNFIDLTTTKSIQLDVYSTSSFGMLVAAENPGGSAPRSAADDDTDLDYVGGSGWQTITVTLNQNLDGTVTANGEYELLAFFPGWNNATNGWVTGAPGVGVPNTVYIDNIRGVQGSAIGPSCTDGVMNGDETGVDCGGSCPNACPSPPAGPPTVPPGRDPMDVISVYSNAYTQADTDGFQTFGSAVVTELDYSGNTIQQVTTPDNGSGLQYQYFGTTPQYLDLTAMTNMHIDFYFEGSPTAPGTVFFVIVFCSSTLVATTTTAVVARATINDASLSSSSSSSVAAIAFINSILYVILSLTCRII